MIFNLFRSSRSAGILMAVSFCASFAAGQRLTQGDKPVAATLADTNEAYCSNVGGGVRVCKVLRAADEAEFVIYRGSSAVDRIDGQTWRSIAVEPDGFFAYRGDLDNDGKAEIVLVSLEGVSQGMGVTYATAYIFDGRTLGSGSKPIAVPIQEFGERENFIYDPQTRRTEILISYWASYDSIEPRRAVGTYLIGKFFRYRNGKLEPILEKPTLARRFLNSFASERDNGWFENRKPFTWLTARSAHKLYREPSDRAKLVAVRSAVISSYDSGKFDLTTDDGSVITGRVNDDRASLKITSVGILKGRYCYPMPFGDGFTPEPFFEPVGRRVRLETFRTEFGDGYTRVWLLD